MSITYVRYWGSYFKRSRYTASMEIFRSITKAGWNAYIVCSKPPEDPRLLERVLDTGVKVVYLPRPRRSFDIGCMWRAYRLCRQLRCDIFHCDNMHTSPLIGAALAGVPVRLWSKRAMNKAYEMQKKPTLRDRVVISVRVSSWLATKVLPVSSAVKNELVDLGIPSSKFIVFPNSIEVKEINEDTRNRVRSELGYTNGQIVFTTVGHAVPVKGWDVLIRSFAGVLKECPTSRLQLVGSVTDVNEREHYEILKNCVREYDIADRVHFMGRVQDITKVLAASDVFVLSSRSEGYGKALVEAMMSGMPCIATKVGCATDVIEDGVNGLLVERGNEEQLSNAMISLAKNPKLRSQVANAVRAKKRYAPTFSEYGDRLIGLFCDLLQDRQKAKH